MTYNVVFRPMTRTDHLGQALINSLRYASYLRNVPLCVRILSAILHNLKGSSLVKIDNVCEMHQIPLMLVADLSQSWDSKKYMCISPADLSKCPFQVTMLFGQRPQLHTQLHKIPMDPTRPNWVRNACENSLYLEKCGILVPKQPTVNLVATQFLQDPVTTGKVKLELVTK